MKFILPLTIALFICASVINAQDCAPPQIVANAGSSNLFSAEQEMILGDLVLQSFSSEFRQVKDAQLVAFVDAIGAKLIRHLPKSGLQFKFHIIEYPEANAFNIPGGHVFLSRKLISFVNSEDELAGVMAHELGHATVHHGAVDMSASMRKILNVTSLGDRKDIVEKYNRLIENARTKRVSQRGGHENEQQLEADKIGFFSMVAAGYAPTATFTFFDRLTESEGKTGSWLGDLFGSVKPNEKRLREIAQSTAKLPAACRDGRTAQATEDFLKWQADVVMYRDAARKENLPGLMWKREITPKLRSDIDRIGFSSDGRLLLVQDDFSISIIDKGSMQVTLQIAAEDVKKAYFTAENKQVVFTTDNLRFERWDLEKKKAIEVRELVLRRDCWEHELSPDGKYLACVDQATTVKLIETATGKKVWEKKEFYPLSVFEYVTWLRASSSDTRRVSFFRIEFSPDSRFVMFSRSNKYRFRVKVDFTTVDSSENTALAIDLSTMKPIDTGGDTKKVASRAYIFLDSERIMGSSEAKVDAGGIFSFPQGKRLQKLQFGGEDLERTANSNYVNIKPLANTKMGIYDIKRNAIVAGMNKNDIAVHGDLIAFESVSGKIIFREAKYDEAKKSIEGNDIATLEIPAYSINDMNVAEVSDDFSWMVMSSKTRGGVWNLKTGERSVYTRGFTSGIVDTVGNGIADFPKFLTEDHSLAMLTSKDGSASPVRILPEFGVRQYGRFLLSRKPLKEDDDKKAQQTSSQFALSEEQKAEVKLHNDVSFEIKSWLDDKVKWQRDFKGVVPRYSFDSFSGRLLIYWRLSSDEGKAKLKEDPALSLRASTLGDKAGDYLVEIVDAFAQKTVGNLLLETGKGSFGVGSGQSESDWVVLKDSEGRILVYSIKDGTLKHRFFGKHAAINPAKSEMVVENTPGEVTLYSLDSGDAIAQFTIAGGLAFARFNLQGDRLFLFSDTQAGYSIDLTKSKLSPKQIIF